MPGGEFQVPDQSETALATRGSLGFEKSPKSPLIEVKKSLELSVKTNLEVINKTVARPEDNESEKTPDTQVSSLSEDLHKAEETLSQSPETKGPDTITSYRELGGDLKEHLNRASQERSVVDNQIEMLSEQINDKQRLILEQKLGMGKLTHLRSIRQVQKEIEELRSERGKGLKQHDTLAAQEHDISITINRLEVATDKATEEVVVQR